MNAVIIIDLIAQAIAVFGFGVTISYLILTPKLPKLLSAMIPVFFCMPIYATCCYSKLYLELIPDFGMQQNIKTILLPLVYILYVIIAFKERISTKIAVIFINLVFTFVLEGLYSGIALLQFGVNFEDFRTALTVRDKIIAMSIVMLVYFFVYLFTYISCKFLFKKKRSSKMPISVLINFLAIILVNIIMMAFVMTSNAKNHDTPTFVLTILSPVLLAGLSITLYKMLVRVNEQEILKEKLYWVENVKNLELDYYEELKQKSNEVRKIRHDFKDNLETIHILINENTLDSISKAQSILNSIDKQISTTKIPVYTENIVVNTIVGAKSEDAAKKLIKFEANIDLPKELPIESIDLNCIFLNLLNNAIESCEKITDTDKRHIEIKSAIQAGFLFIKILNSSAEIPCNESEKNPTTKPDRLNHGFGISLIKDIVNKYNGSFESKYNNGVYSSVASLEIKCDAGDNA